MTRLYPQGFLRFLCPLYSGRIFFLKFLLELTAAQAGEFYNMRCPVAAESKEGKTWADVH